MKTSSCLFSFSPIFKYFPWLPITLRIRTQISEVLHDLLPPYFLATSFSHVFCVGAILPSFWFLGWLCSFLAQDLCICCVLCLECSPSPHLVTLPSELNSKSNLFRETFINHSLLLYHNWCHSHSHSLCLCFVVLIRFCNYTFVFMIVWVMCWTFAVF